MCCRSSRGSTNRSKPRSCRPSGPNNYTFEPSGRLRGDREPLRRSGVNAQRPLSAQISVFLMDGLGGVLLIKSIHSCNVTLSLCYVKFRDRLRFGTISRFKYRCLKADGRA